MNLSSLGLGLYQPTNTLLPLEPALIAILVNLNPEFTPEKIVDLKYSNNIFKNQQKGQHATKTLKDPIISIVYTKILVNVMYYFE